MADEQKISGRLLFMAKVAVLRARRALENIRTPLSRWPQTAIPRSPGARTEIRTPLYVDPRAEELGYELGKVANLRAAVRYLDGLEIPAGGVFSFWHHVGRATGARGFVTGRMLQSGCVVPAIGGGLCQLSNALYELALRTDCEIVERHPHSQRLPGTPLRDATVAWNYIDLRFRARGALRLELHLTSTELVAAFVTEAATASRAIFPVVEVPVRLAETCATCNEADCSRHEAPALVSVHTTAFLVDPYWPEFDRYIQSVRRPGDLLVMPINGKRWRLPQYAWSTMGFQSVVTTTFAALNRSRRMRRFAQQGAARQNAAQDTSAEIARQMVRRIPFSVGHLVVDQTLLPELWRSGALGGRAFEVLLRRLPMRLLQQRLDSIAERWPESPTAADFRADPRWLDLEDEALAHAQSFITPHRELAALFPAQTTLLDWEAPAPKGLTRQQDGEIPRLYFPGPVTARKGAYLLREALRGMTAEVLWRGSELEGAGFWGSVRNRRVQELDQSIAAVVQPAFLEDQPRTLLRALACGIAVITSAASGLTETAGLTFFDPTDATSLRACLGLVAERNRGSSAEPALRSRTRIVR